MKKIIAVLLLCGSAPAWAAPDAFVDALANYKELLPAAKVAAVAGQAAAAPKKLETSFVNLSGNVNLQGSGYVSPGSRWVSVNLTGWTDVSDASGQVRSGMTNISTMANLFINGTWVSDWARPSVSVSLYRNGRYVGSAFVNGNIYVSGSVNGNWVNISGSGTLTGSASVSD